jgi:hypothetical protein
MSGFFSAILKYVSRRVCQVGMMIDIGGGEGK